MNYQDLIREGKVVADTRIDGEFEGFDDEVLFPLTNGEYWLQATYQYWYHYAYMPSVKIYRYRYTYYLVLEGAQQFVPVERVEVILEATIVSDFKGWTGHTLFELDNGQIWQQSSYAYQYHYAYRPHALIYATGSGYKLLVDGKSVPVRRIR